MAAVSGCVSVNPPAGPAPAAPEASRPARDVAPQIVEGPARDALEAALPSPTGSPAPRPPGEPDRPAHRGPSGAAAPEGREERAPGVPRAPRVPSADELREQLPGVRPPALPSVPLTVPDACALDEGYGGWDGSGEEARLCSEAYGH